MADWQALVVTPPMTQLNSPYPAGAHLVPWLQAHGITASQVDLALGLALRLYSADGVGRMIDAMAAGPVPEAAQAVVDQADRYQAVIGPLIRFLQGREPGLARRIVAGRWLPRGPRFEAADHDAAAIAFGSQGQTDHARWLGTLVVQDLADAIRATVSPHFGLTSYGHSIADSASSFDPLADHLAAAPDPIEGLLLELLPQSIPESTGLVALTAPFPGNLPAALRIAQWCREHRPFAHIALGGGYPSTELRELQDPRIFDVVDSIVIDDGESPLLQLARRVQGAADAPLVRTFQRDPHGQVQWHDGPPTDPHHRQRPAPDYSDLPLGDYLDLIDTWNPMHRLWNEGRWLKQMAAHGCYWARCTFCDTSLPYIADYQPVRGRELADRMRRMARATGHSGFHFVDEAAPPPLLVELALELLRGGDQFQWWGNIRFESSFTPDRCRLLAAAGMIAVSGGIEVADDAVLERIAKGVSIPELVPVLQAFSAAGILTHGYLMYGFPGMGAQETVDSMEVVRQLIAAGLLHSGFWHRFTVTAHSPVGRDPAAFGVQVTGPTFQGFARNNLTHIEPGGFDHDRVHDGLVASMQAWLAGQDLDLPPQAWFDRALPPSRHEAGKVASLVAEAPPTPRPTDRVVWLGGRPRLASETLRVVDDQGETIELAGEPEDLAVVAAVLGACHPTGWPDGRPPRLRDLDAEPDDLDPWRELGMLFL